MAPSQLAAPSTIGHNAVNPGYPLDDFVPRVKLLSSIRHIKVKHCSAAPLQHGDGGLGSAGVSWCTMASRGKKRKAKAPVYVPAVPDESRWLECDSYDRRVWKEILASAPTVAQLVESGENLVPYFGALLQDIFLGLFKYNLVWLEPDQVRRSAMLNRTILRQLLASPTFEALKLRTLLEEDKAAIAAMALGEEVIEMVRSQRLINRREMLDLWDLKHQEEDLKERAEALKAAGEQPPSEAGQESSTADAQELARKMEELKEAAAR